MKFSFMKRFSGIRPGLITMVTLTMITVTTSGLPAAAAESGEAAAAKLSGEVSAHLEKAQTILDSIVGVSGERNMDNTLLPMNKLSLELSAASSKASLMQNVHPDPDVRTAAEKASQDVSAFITELSLNRDFYDAIDALDADKYDALTQRLIKKNLRDFRRSGVDKDEATRNKIKALQEELVEIGQEYSRNIRDGQRTMYLDSVDELDGLPQDYIDAHQPNEDGKIEITTAYPDYGPIMSYAKNGDVRKRIYHEFNNRAYPTNIPVFKKLLEKRYELANLLGYENWAAYVTDDKMIGNPKNAHDFITRLDKATKDRAKLDYEMLLKRKRQDDPQAKEVFDWEKSYYSELVQSELYKFDSQKLRAYYNYPEVQQGMLDLTAKLFGVSYKHIPDAEVWHEDVDCYELYEDGALKGRFYLDMHPRDGKYSHAAQFDLQTGVVGVQIPMAVLVCNFPKPDENGLGLMEHSQVETFLHEFGHLLHTLFGGHQKWADQSGIATEWDFVEAPSQMLEEWALDAKTLQAFAKHHETGEPIPADLIENLRQSREFGNGIYVRQQTFYSAISLNAYDQHPSKVDMDKMVPKLQAKYSSFSYIDDAHMHASFGHLHGYSAMYYTYMWSLVIAKDLFSRFNPEQLMDPQTAGEYRRLVLDPGGTKDAKDLVKDFLGRDYNFDAFQRWLNGAS